MNPPSRLSGFDFESVIRRIGENTIEWRTGRQPAAGFAVAPSKTTERQIPLADFAAEHVSKYVRAFHHLLNLPGMCLGARAKGEPVAV